METGASGGAHNIRIENSAEEERENGVRRVDKFERGLVGDN